MRRTARVTLVTTFLVMASTSVAMANETTTVTLEVDCPAEIAAPGTLTADYDSSDTGSSYYESESFEVTWDPGCGSGSLQAELGVMTGENSTINWEPGFAYGELRPGPDCRSDDQEIVTAGAVSVSSVGGAVDFCLRITIPGNTPDGIYTGDLTFTVVPGP